MTGIGEFVQELYAGQRPERTDGNPRFKLAADPRITRIGRFLRRSSLDELPQLWNVVRGEMSLVGPRPPIFYEVEAYPADHWFTRFEVKPGLTGLWQVSGRCELTLDEMIALDIDYVRRRSCWLNLRILLRTLPAVLGQPRRLLSDTDGPEADRPGAVRRRGWSAAGQRPAARACRLRGAAATCEVTALSMRARNSRRVNRRYSGSSTRSVRRRPRGCIPLG